VSPSQFRGTDFPISNNDIRLLKLHGRSIKAPDPMRVENPGIVEVLPTPAMRVSRSLLSVLLICALLVSTVRAQPPVGASQIKHVVFILKENHTFDNYFGAFPDADGASTGKIHTGATVPLTRALHVSPGDIYHPGTPPCSEWTAGRWMVST
jgi:phospholipase C